MLTSFRDSSTISFFFTSIWLYWPYCRGSIALFKCLHRLVWNWYFCRRRIMQQRRNCCPQNIRQPIGNLVRKLLSCAEHLSPQCSSHVRNIHSSNEPVSQKSRILLARIEVFLKRHEFENKLLRCFYLTRIWSISEISWQLQQLPFGEYSGLRIKIVVQFTESC